jgi:hypothetical protein
MVIVILSVLAGFVVFLAVATAVYQWRLSHHRGISRDEFIRHFRDRDIPDAVSAAVYDYYKSGVISRKFGVAPDDRLADLFSDLLEDLEIAAKTLITKLGMKDADISSLEQRANPHITVGDMVLWLDRLRKDAGANVVTQ